MEPERTEPTPAWIAARLWQLRYVKDARASTRTLRVTEAPDAAFARKKLAELSAKSHSDAKPEAARAALACARAAESGCPLTHHSCKSQPHTDRRMSG